MEKVLIIGGGLAGCECASTLAAHGVASQLVEMKPHKKSPAHKTDDLGELVCSNSLKADRPASASGMLKREMDTFGSLVLDCARASKVPAGGALAVDRDQFAGLMTKAMMENPLIDLKRGEMTDLPAEGITVVATGPLTAEPLAGRIGSLCGEESLSFFDAAAPVVTKDSIDMQKAFFAARYGRGDDDYINCPMNREEYEVFHEALTAAQSVELPAYEKEQFRVYEGCMPVEVLARRGTDSIRFGPLKPVGLTDPRTGHRPYAVVQLRTENREGTLYNLVGFQTNLRFPEQKRVFSLIPGLENSEFVRYGVMHRNTFLNSPKLLQNDLSLITRPDVFFAGQITGVEGYVESAAMGIFVAQQILRRLAGKSPLVLPGDTMMGALVNHITQSTSRDFQPMGANMGLLPPLDERVREKAERYGRISDRGFDSLRAYLAESNTP